MKKKALAKTEKCDKDLSTKEEKQNLWENRINTWEGDLLICAMFASSWQMAAKCSKQKYHWPIMKMRL